VNFLVCILLVVKRYIGESTGLGDGVVCGLETAGCVEVQFLRNRGYIGVVLWNGYCWLSIGTVGRATGRRLA
jgi:hypothetical protein